MRRLASVDGQLPTAVIPQHPAGNVQSGGEAAEYPGRIVSCALETTDGRQPRGVTQGQPHAVPSGRQIRPAVHVIETSEEQLSLDECGGSVTGEKS